MGRLILLQVAGVSAIEIVTLAIGGAGLGLAALSLGWQAATFFMSGPRVKVRFGEGFRGPLGVMIAPPGVYTEQGLASLEHQGYTEHVLAVTAMNKGRFPATIRNWSICFGNRATFTNPQDLRNPPLPHKLEPHTAQTWYAPVDEVVPFVDMFSDQNERARTASGAVDTATNKTVVSRQRIVVGADSTTRTRHSRITRALAFARRRPLY